MRLTWPRPRRGENLATVEHVDPAPSVDLQGVSHAFSGGQPLFETITFRFDPGLRYAVTGASGSGKSTLLSILAGWTKPSVGEITQHGIRTTGWVFQNPHGSARRTALDHVTLPPLARGLSRAAAKELGQELLTSFGLEDRHDAQFRHLSGGEAQRLMLARAVAYAPQLLLVDEPTAQLDSRSARTVNDALGRVSISGGIVIVATHDPRTAAACDVQIELSP